jgi:mannose-6-phosphate isomerase-like protein (cupin superfamily)
MADYSVAIPRQEESGSYPIGEEIHFDLKERLELSELRAQMWYFAPGESSFYHLHHQQEELYYLVDGPAQIRVGRGDDEDVVDFDEGTTVKVPPGVPRQLLNETDSASQWLVVASPNVREAVIYHDERDEFVPLDEFLELYARE